MWKLAEAEVPGMYWPTGTSFLPSATLMTIFQSRSSCAVSLSFRVKFQQRPFEFQLHCHSLPGCWPLSAYRHPRLQSAGSTILRQVAARVPPGLGGGVSGCWKTLNAVVRGAARQSDEFKAFSNHQIASPLSQ
jgi:hypothetical protein